jgi:hypothetical protein
MLLKEHRFKFCTGVETHLFMVEELITGLALWPDKFRIRVLSASCEAKTFYGATCEEASQKAAKFMARGDGQFDLAESIPLPQRSPTPPPRDLLLQRTPKKIKLPAA